MPPRALPTSAHSTRSEMVVPSHTMLGHLTKQETKFLSSSPMIPVAPLSTSANPGRWERIAMLVLTIPPSLSMLTWDGLSRDIVTGLLRPRLHQSCTPLPPNAGGTTGLNLSPLISGPNLTSPPIFLELVFVKLTGFTNAGVGPMVSGARWQPTNRRKLICGGMHGLVLEPAMACLNPRPVQLHPPLPVQLSLHPVGVQTVDLLPVQAYHFHPL